MIKTIYVDMIKVEWSNTLCMSKQRLTRKHILHKRYDLIERVCTFEGPAYLSSEECIKGVYVPAYYRKIADKFHTHILNTTF